MKFITIATFLSISVQAAVLFSSNVGVSMEKANIDGANHHTRRLVRRQRDSLNNRRGNGRNNGNGFNNGNGRNNGNGFNNGDGRNKGNGFNNGGPGTNFAGRDNGRGF